MADEVADAGLGLAALLEWGEPMAIAFYPHFAAKEQLVQRARALAAPRGVIEVHDAEQAMAHVGEDVLVVIDPSDEVTAVSCLDRNRDRFTGGGDEDLDAPADADVPTRFLLLLLRGGVGERALGTAPALASFARDASFEVVAAPSRAEAAATFAEEHGIAHDEWLRRWRAGEIPDTIENNQVLGHALAIDGEGRP